MKCCFEDIDPNYPNYDKEEEILLTLRVFEDIIDFSEMFHDCEGLYSFPDYYNRENEDIEDIEDIEDYNLTNKTQSMEQTIKYEKLGNKKNYDFKENSFALLYPNGIHLNLII